jgi:hypothetical protein
MFLYYPVCLMMILPHWNILPLIQWIFYDCWILVCLISMTHASCGICSVIRFRAFIDTFTKHNCFPRTCTCEIPGSNFSRAAGLLSSSSVSWANCRICAFHLLLWLIFVITLTFHSTLSKYSMNRVFKRLNTIWPVSLLTRFLIIQIFPFLPWDTY